MLPKDNKKYDLVTCDGGFKFENELNQEQESVKLIIGQIYSGLSSLEKGRTYILKIFESLCNITLSIIFSLTKYFDSVTINKPCTSRPSNSEKYIMCQGYNGCPEIKIYEEALGKDQFIKTIFEID